MANRIGTPSSNGDWGLDFLREAEASLTEQSHSSSRGLKRSSSDSASVSSESKRIAKHTQDISLQVDAAVYLLTRKNEKDKPVFKDIWSKRGIYWAHLAGLLQKAFIGQKTIITGNGLRNRHIKFFEGKIDKTSQEEWDKLYQILQIAKKVQQTEEFPALSYSDLCDKNGPFSGRNPRRLRMMAKMVHKHSSYEQFCQKPLATYYANRRCLQVEMIERVAAEYLDLKTVDEVLKALSQAPPSYFVLKPTRRTKTACSATAGAKFEGQEVSPTFKESFSRNNENSPVLNDMDNSRTDDDQSMENVHVSGMSIASALLPNLPVQASALPTGLPDTLTPQTTFQLPSSVGSLLGTGALVLPASLPNMQAPQTAFQAPSSVGSLLGTGASALLASLPNTQVPQIAFQAPSSVGSLLSTRASALLASLPNMQTPPTAFQAPDSVDNLLGTGL